MSLEILIWVALAVLLIMGTPIFVSLGMASITVLLLSDIPLSLVMIDLIKVSDMFPLLAVVGFVFAGALMERGGMAAQIVEVASMLVGHIRGGLGIVTILGCMFFASMIGSGPGTVAAMGSIMIPSMIKRGYSPEYAAGVSATGGTLGILIPPSIMLVFMGSAANVSVGQLFYGAIVPGLLLGAAYIVYIKIVAVVKKDYAPPMPAEQLARYSRKQVIWGVIVNVLPVALVIFSVLGAIWLGWCPATEAAALGVVASFLIALLTHSINAQVIKKTLIESIKLTSMVYAVSAFGNLFVTVFMRLGCSNAVTNLFVHLPLGKWGLFALMMAVVFLLGFLMDWIAVCMITIPIFVPIATAAGFDACYFLTMMAIIMQTAFLSPPMAASIFYFQGVAKDRITTAETIHGIWPFMALQVLVFVLCILFPQIVTWLPGHMIG